MNKLFLALVFFICSINVYAQLEIDNDIYIYTKLERKWNGFLLDEFQQILDNFEVNLNHHKITYEGDINYSAAQVRDMVDPGMRLLISSIQKMAGLDILGLTPELTVRNLGYETEQIVPDIIVKKDKDDITLNTTVLIKGLKLFSSAINLNLDLKDSRGNLVKTIKFGIENPVVDFGNKTSVPLKTTIRIEDNKGSFKLNILDKTFKSLTGYLKSKSANVSISYSNLNIPEVSFRLMGREIKIDPAKIKNIIDIHKPMIQDFIIEEFVKFIQSGGANDLFKIVEDEVIKKDKWFNTEPDEDTDLDDLSIIGLRVNKLEGIEHSNVVFASVGGMFCTYEKYQTYLFDCPDFAEIKTPLSYTTIEDDKYSRKAIEDELKKDKQLKLIISLKEDYINKIIAHTLEMGFFEDTKKEFKIELGEKGVSVRANENGDEVTVYIDAIRDVGKVHGLLLKERYVNMPIVLKARPRVEYQKINTTEILDSNLIDEIVPHLVLKIIDIDISDETLLYGVPEYDLQSTIQDVRKLFRNKVLKTLRGAFMPYTKAKNNGGFDLPGLMLPQLHNLKLEQSTIKSDGRGRLNIKFNQHAIRTYVNKL